MKESIKKTKTMKNIKQNGKLTITNDNGFKFIPTTE